MLYSPCHIYDIKETEIDYIENIEKADNYFEWITYDGKQTQEYQDRKFNDLQIIDNNRPTFSNSINFEVNDITNQNGIDILAVSAGYGNGKNANEYLTDKQLHQYTDITNVSINPNILKDTEKYIVNETSDKKIPQDRNNLDVYSRIPESYTPEEKQQDSITEQNNNMPQLSNMLEEVDITVEDPNYLHELILEEDSEKLEKIEKKINKLNQQELLLKNEKQEILKFLNQSGPPDNMRNRKKPKTHDYNYNLSLPDCNKTKVSY